MVAILQEIAMAIFQAPIMLAHTIGEEPSAPKRDPCLLRDT